MFSVFSYMQKVVFSARSKCSTHEYILVLFFLPEGRVCHYFDHTKNCTTPGCKTETCLSESALCVVLYKMGKSQSKPKVTLKDVEI